LTEDIENNFGLKSGFAGRSGGWIEVDFDNNLSEVNKDTPKGDINYYYKIAKGLENKEKEVKQFIKNAHYSYNLYVDSDGYYRDIADCVLLQDEDIADIYKNTIKTLTSKLN
jgi:hypothetical protein